MTKRSVVFAKLSRTEMEGLLARHHVGRMAFTFRDRVDIEPIHYVYADGDLFGRTAPGAKLTVLAHHPWVAFEVDEVRGPFDWRSVVVKGTVYVIEPDAGRGAYQLALKHIRSVMPDALTPDDPVPERSVVFRIHVHEMEGREARTIRERRSPARRTGRATSKVVRESLICEG